MIRITSGEFRGRSLQTPPGLKTRPTQAKLRQALFNSVQLQLPEARVLELFAGSGGLGFEALSRGAAHVTFVENHRSALSCLKDNSRLLGVEARCRILAADVEGGLKEPSAVFGREPYDLVLADPPYELGWELRLLNHLPWGELLAEDGLFCLEWCPLKAVLEELPDEVPGLVKVREKNYGDSVLTTYKRGTLQP